MTGLAEMTWTPFWSTTESIRDTLACLIWLNISVETIECHLYICSAECLFVL